MSSGDADGCTVVGISSDADTVESARRAIRTALSVAGLKKPNPGSPFFDKHHKGATAKLNSNAQDSRLDYKSNDTGECSSYTTAIKRRVGAL